MRYMWLIAICAASLVAAPALVSAQDDETPEQKRLMDELVAREQVAAEERAGAEAYVPPEGLMEEKEKDRAKLMKDEERDVTREGSYYPRRRWR